MRNRPQTQGQPEQVGHDLLGGPLRQAIRPRAQGHDGVHAWPKAPRRHPTRQVRAGQHPACRAAQLVQLILCHMRLYGGHLSHLMPVWLGILALQWVLTAPTLLGLDRDHSVDLLHGDQRPGLPGMAWLPPTLAATRPPACAFRQRLWRITRRRPRGVLGVLLEAFEQSLDCSLQFGNARFEGADILADGKGRLLPQLRWERGCGVHGPASYATWIPVSKPHGLRPRERLPKIFMIVHMVLSCAAEIVYRH